MSLIDILKGQYRTGEFVNMGEGKWWQGATGWGGGAKDVKGFPVTADSAMNSSAAFACTRAIADTLASLPAIVYEHLDGEERKRVRENPMWVLLHDQANRYMDATTWYGLNLKRLINRGNSVNIIEFNRRGVPIALWPVHNSRWMAFQKPSRQRQGRFYPGDITYRVWPDKSADFYDVGQDEVLNIVGFDTEDGVIARGVPDRARGEISLSMAQQEYSSSMLNNGAIPLGLIKHPWIEDDTRRENFRADINSMHQGRENWNRVGILWDEKAEWTGLNFSPKDVEAIDSRKFTDKSICRFYNVPPAIVQIFDDYKFATVEAMLKHFVTLCLRSYAVRVERSLNLQVLDQVSDSLFMEFALESLLRGDPKAQAETNALLRQWGVINADEWRQRDLNMNRLPEGMGEMYILPSNFTTADRLASGENLSSPSGGGSQNKPNTKKLASFDKSYLAALMQAADAGIDISQLVQFDLKPNIPQKIEVPENTEQSKELARKVLQHQLTWMISNEVKALTKIAEQPEATWESKIHIFYDKFKHTLATALSIEAACKELGVTGLQIAEQHCMQSEYKLADRRDTSIVQCISSWSSRTIDWSLHVESAD